MTFPHTLEERKGPFTCPRCAAPIRFVQNGAYGPAPFLEHDDIPGPKENAPATFSVGDFVRVTRARYKGQVMRATMVREDGMLQLAGVLVIAPDGVEHCNVCTWLDEATDEQVEALK